MTEKPDKYEQAGKKVQETGKKIQTVGCALTLLITIPIVGALVFGTAGLVIGIIIGIVGIAAMFADGKKKKKAEGEGKGQ